MARVVQLATRVLYGTGVVASLGFGALQLTATPAQAAMRACFDEYCDDLCRVRGATYGFCDTTLNQCVCIRV